MMKAFEIWATVNLGAMIVSIFHSLPLAALAICIGADPCSFHGVHSECGGSSDPVIRAFLIFVGVQHILGIVAFFVVDRLHSKGKWNYGL